MPIAINPETNEALFLDEAGAWKPARVAENPQTKEKLAFDGRDWQPLPSSANQAEKSRGLFGTVDDIVRSVANGLTLGYADEFAAKADELTGSGSYEENLKREDKRTDEISPWIRIPGEIGGGVAGAVAAAPVTGAAAVASGVSRLPALLRHAGAGGVLGALYGSGNSDPGERTSGAIQGGLVGAPLGAAAPYAMQGAANLARGIRGAFQPSAQVQADLGRAIFRDADTPASLGTRMSEAARERGNVATLADVGGENVRGLVERIAQTPGAGRTKVVPTLTERQQEQAGRLSADLAGLTGTQRTATQAIDETMAARATAARPLYEEAFNFNASKVPALTKEWKRTTANGWGKSILESPDFRKTLQTEYGIKDAAKAPLMVQIDAWKKQVDGVIGEAVRAGNNNKARVLGEMRDRMVAAVDRANPAYGRARDAWAGPSRYLDAVEDGRNILSSRVSAEELRPRLARMSDAEREAFRIGAVSAIRGKMGADPAKLGDMTKYLRSPEMRDKIAAIMPTGDAARRWATRLNFEVSASELTGRSLGNSATARRLAERSDADGIAGDLVLDVLSGTPAAGIFRRVVGGASRRVRDTARSRTDDLLADMLLQPQSEAELTRLLRRAQRAGAPLSDRARSNAIVGAEIGASNY